MRSATVVRVVAAALLGLVSRGAVAQVDDDAGQRARIATQRAQAQVRYDAQAAECRRRFVVTACLNDAQRERREALDGLRRQQLLLDDAQRRQRAADRMTSIRSKEAATDPAASSSQPTRLPTKPPPTTMRLRQGSRERAPAAAADQAASAAEGLQPPAPANPAPTGKPRRDRGDRSSRNDAASEQARLKRQQEQQERQAEMAAHRQAVERRNAERAASARKPAAPLPVPAGTGVR